MNVLPSLDDGSIAVLPDRASAKKAMRDPIRAERRTRDQRTREADAWGLAAVALEQPEILRARCVATYASMPYAPGTQPLRQALRAGGVRVLLPVLLDDGRLNWYLDGDNDGPPESIGQADVLIIPALAVDTLGHRLGQSGGLYGRTLREISRTVMVFAVVHETEVLDAAVEQVPYDPSDRPVDAVLTPNRCLYLPAHVLR